MARRHDLTDPRVIFAACVAAALPMAATFSVAAEVAHPHVMSLNVCTDQLVLALADPDQIVSLSILADDPNLSFLHGKAASYPKNGGVAEDVFIAHPDIVVTGTYSLHDTAAILQRVGTRVEAFGYSQTLDTIPADIRRMGRILRQEARAETAASDFEKELGAIEAARPEKKPSVVVFEQNGIVLGADTLADSALKAAGFRNLAAEHGYTGMVPYPLELLVQDRPDLVLLSRPYNDAPALADQIARHPAIAALGTAHSGEAVPRGSWACGGPFTIEAVRALARLRDQLLADEKPAG